MARPHSRMLAPRLVVEAADIAQTEPSVSTGTSHAMGSYVADPLRASTTFSQHQSGGILQLPPNRSATNEFEHDNTGSVRATQLALIASSAAPPSGAAMDAHRASAAASMDPGARGTQAVTWTASHGFGPSLGGNDPSVGRSNTPGRAGDAINAGGPDGVGGRNNTLGRWEGRGEALYAELAATGEFVRIRGARAQQAAGPPRAPQDAHQRPDATAAPMEVLQRSFRMPWSDGLEGVLLIGLDFSLAALAGLAIAMSIVSSGQADDAMYVTSSALHSGNIRTAVLVLGTVAIVGAWHAIEAGARPLVESLHSAGSWAVAQEAYDRQQAVAAQGRQSTFDQARGAMGWLPDHARALVAPATTGVLIARVTVLVLAVGGHLATLLSARTESLLSAANGKSSSEIQAESAGSGDVEPLDRATSYRVATISRAVLFSAAALIHTVLHRQRTMLVDVQRASAVHEFAQQRWGALAK